MIGVKDFSVVANQFDLCWNLENHDAPLLLITAPKENAVYKEYNVPLMEKWLNIELVLERNRQHMNNTYYGGVSFPFAWPNLGPDIFGAMMGCGLEFGERTSWAKHLECPLEEIVIPQIDESNEWYKKILDMTQAMLDDAGDDYLVGVTDIHGGLDGLVSLRGPETLCMDLIENPEIVKRLNDESFLQFKHVYTELKNKIGKQQQGSVNWMGIYHKDEWYIPSCDFMCLISNDMYQEFVDPEIRMEVELFKNNVFHLDGPGALRHLDSLLEIEGLQGVQWVYGSGQPTAAHWIEVMKKIQSKGKMVQVLATEKDLPVLKQNLKPEGLILHMESSSEKNAREIEDYVSSWKK